MLKIEPGQIIGESFEVISELGAGGSGVVYLAQDTSLNRKVAIKILHVTNQDSAALQRFDREAKALCQLSHSNIVHVFRYGLLDDNSPYIAMEYLEGDSLRSIVSKSGGLPCDEAIAIAAQICAALEYAHSHHIIHRDLKPENIIVSQGPDGPLVKILDFGLCKSEVVDGNKQATLTETGFLVGTAQYMSPEQCYGQPVDWRTDIYSFSCVLFELITGKPPFASESIAQVLLDQVSVPMPKLLDLSPACGLPEKLQDLILKCGAKEKAARYQSFTEVMADLVTIASLNCKKRFVASKYGGAARKRIPFGLIAAILAMLCCAELLYLLFTDSGNVLIANQIQAAFPPASATSYLDSAVKNLLGSKRNSSADAITNETINSGVFRRWSSVERDRLINNYIELNEKAGRHEKAFDLRLVLLSELLDSLFRSKTGSVEPEKEEINLLDQLSKFFLAAKLNVKQFTKLSFVIEQKSGYYAKPVLDSSLWPTVLRLEAIRGKHKKLSIDALHDYAVIGLTIVDLAYQVHNEKIGERYYKEMMESCKANEFLLIETELCCHRGLYRAEKGDMEGAEKELAHAKESSKTLLLSSSRTGRFQQLVKSCELKHYITGDEYRKMYPEGQRANNPFMEFVK